MEINLKLRKDEDGKVVDITIYKKNGKLLEIQLGF